MFCHTFQYFDFSSMPCGLSDCRLIFQRYIYIFFRELNNKKILTIYINDFVSSVTNNAIMNLINGNIFFHLILFYGFKILIAKQNFITILLAMALTHFSFKRTLLTINFNPSMLWVKKTCANIKVINWKYCSYRSFLKI